MNCQRANANRKAPESTKYLIDLCQDDQIYNAFCNELIKALEQTGLPEAKEALLSTVDNSISSPKVSIPTRNGRDSLERA